MTVKRFKALVAEETDGAFMRRVTTRTVDDLPDGDLLIRVTWSSLNFKDALSASGNKSVTKRYPHTPGIDAAGIVEYSSVQDFAAGDEIIVTGYDLGMDTDGGFGQYIRVPADWALKLPAGLTARDAMIFGTAGFTAGISVSRLVEHVAPEAGEIVVSGATGGVGSMSVAILARLGYRVAAVTGKPDERDFLERLGAGCVLARQALQEDSGRPLLHARWAGGIDTVGGPVLATMLRSIHPSGAVTCCGNVGGANLHLTVYPFILRGISLIGIDSQHYPMEDRIRLWHKLAGAWRPPQLASMAVEKTLEELDDCITRMLAGRLKGRVLVNLQQGL